MFKIRTLNPQDIEKLENSCDDTEALNKIKKNMFSCVLQSMIPYNLRFFPSIHFAVEEKEILGFVILQCLSKSNNAWQIEHVFVSDRYRNEGIGEELVRYVLSVYGGYGIENFIAKVDPKNSAAISLFQACGFRRFAKVFFYEKEIGTISESKINIISFDKDFVIRPQTLNDLSELEKLALSSIPPDLRHILCRSKSYFKEKRNSFSLIHKSRNMLIGWFNIEEITQDYFSIELLMSPGWTHLYEQLLNTVIYDYIGNKSDKVKIRVKAIDYITELAQVLNKLGFLASDVRELLVRTIWQRVREKQKKPAQIGLPSTAPT